MTTLVVGDIHGDLNQLLYPLFEFLDNQNIYKRIVFLGDYIDRGESNLNIYLIIKFFIENPSFKDKIIFLCGNHDVWEDTYGFNPYIKPMAYTPEIGGVVRTFVFQSLTQLPLELSYYVPEWNVLFTHSPQVRRINGVYQDKVTGIDITPCQLSDATRDKMRVYTWFNDCGANNGQEQHYKNVCGHIHIFDDRALDYMFGEKAPAVLFAPIDGDSCYFFWVNTNFTRDLGIYPKEWKTNVLYISVPEDGQSWTKHVISVPFYGNDKRKPNYNLMTFKDLWQSIKSKLNINDNDADLILKQLEDEGITAFENSFRSEFKIPPDMELTGELILENIKMRRDNNKAIIPLVFFNDVPLEIYQHYGLFMNETVNDIGMLFCKIIWGNLWYKAWKKLFRHGMVDEYSHICEAEHATSEEEPKLDGGYMHVLHTFVCLFLACVCLIVVIIAITLLVTDHTRSRNFNNIEISRI